MKIVVISLERAAERRRQVVAGLEALGLDFEIYPAIDGRKLTPHHKALIDTAGFRRSGRPIRMGSIANWISQRDVLADFVENGPAIMTILEDDTVFAPELPSVLDALQEESVSSFDIVFLHRGPRWRHFVPSVRLRTGHWLGWVRFSNYGAQGYVITRDAARRFLEMNPMIDMGIDRALVRYWHHGLATYCLSPPVVRHGHEGGSHPSLIATMPVVKQTGPLWKVRRYLFDVREGAGKRFAFTRLVFRSCGLIGGCREIFGRRQSVRDETESWEG